MLIVVAGLCLATLTDAARVAGSASMPAAMPHRPKPASPALLPIEPDAAIYEQPSDRITVRTYTPSDGLPAAELRDIEVDRDGFVWIATIGGLAKFDGHQFTPFDADPTNPDAIPRFVTESLASDPVSGMWTTAGVMVHADSLSNQTTRTDITAVRIDRAERLIWAWEPGRVKLFDPVARELVMDTEVAVEPVDGYAVQIATVSDELAVVAGADGIWTVNATGETLHHPTDIPVRDVDLASDGTIWVLDDERLSRYDPATDDLEVVVDRAIAHPDLEAAPITSGGLLERSDGTVWIATELGGVEVYEPSTDTLHLVPPSQSDTGLGAKTGNFYEDSQGGLWMSAFGVGLQYLPAGLPPVWRALMPRRPDGVEIISTYLDLVAIDGTVWAASDGGGLHTYDTRTSEFGEPITTTNSDLPSDSVIGLARRGDELWLGMWGGAITRYNIKTGEFNALASVHDGGPVADDNVFDIVEGPNDTMWAAVWSVGVQVFDGDGTPQLLYGPHGDVVIDGELVISIVPDHDGASWFGGWSGVERVDHRTGEVTRWSMESGDLLGDIVFDLYFDEDETLWIATSAGLEHLDPATGETTYFGRAQGVPGPAVIQIVPVQGLDAIWLATSDRLAEFDLATRRVVQTFGESDGLPAGGFGRYGAAELDDDVTVISTNDGLAFARGSHVPMYDPPVFVTSLSVDDIRSQAVDGAVDVGVDAIRLAFGYTGLDYRQPDGMIYEYRLVGLEDRWVSSTDRVATYSRLAPGDYRFEVRARTASGTVSSEPATLLVTVVPHWWQTLTARVVGVVLFVAAAVTIAMWSLRRTRRRNRELERMVADRTLELEAQTSQAQAANAAKSVFLSNVSHELRNPLQSVLGFAELITLSPPGAQQVKWAEQIYTSGSDLLSMIEELLELSSLESSASPLRVAPVDLRDLVEEIVEGIDHAPTTHKRILASIDLTNNVVWCDSRRLRQVLANLTLNAVRHSTGATVTIGVREEAVDDADSAIIDSSIRRYRFSVRDEGPGMSPEEVAVAFEPFVRGRQAVGSGAGLGLAISRQLVHRLGGALAVDTARDEPTEFYFELDLRVGSGVDHDARHPIAANGEPVTRSTRLPDEHRFEQLRAVVVDPDPLARHAVGDALTLLGLSVRLDDTGARAIATATDRTRRTDLFVISDRLPDIEPAVVVDRIRTTVQGRRPAVLLATSQSESFATIDGIDGILRKPISLSDLAAAVRAVIQVEMV